MNKTLSGDRHPHHIISELEKEERQGAIFKKAPFTRHSPRHPCQFYKFFLLRNTGCP